MIEHIKTTMTAAGCTRAIYESEQMSNITIDAFGPDEVIGIAKEPDAVIFETAGNGVNERFAPMYVEILKQVRPEDTAENNDAIMDALKHIAKDFLFRLIRSGLYQKISRVVATKINERKYDANVMGWSLSMELRPIDNKENC